MNFVFIIDSSLSMSQTFEGISYFETAKSAIHSFVLKREIFNSKLKLKSDKYFLLTLNDDNSQSPIWRWSASTEHFLYQLKAIKQGCDFTDIETAIKNGFNLVNHIRKIGCEKHVYGRLFSAIQNSFIIILTDGGKICNSKNGAVSTVSLLDTDINKKTLGQGNNITQFPRLYNELYRWDQSIYAIILSEEAKPPAYSLLKKYVKMTGGSIYTASNWENLNKIICELTEKVFAYNKVNIAFSDKTFSSINNNKKISKKICSLEGISNDSIKEKWPFPDELLITKDIRSLPIKKAQPFYYISPIFMYNFTIKNEFYDEYEIKNPKIKFRLLTSHVMYNITIQNFLNSCNDSIYFEVTNEFTTNNLDVEPKPFGVIALFFDSLYMQNLQNCKNQNKTLFEYVTESIKKEKKSIFVSRVRCKFFNLPYNYKEFISLLSKYENNLITKPELQIQIEKYCNSIPFYYKYYVSLFLQRKGLLSSDNDSLYRNVEKENINDIIVNEIKKISKYEIETLFDINHVYNKNKQLHLSKNAGCCLKENLYKDDGKVQRVNLISPLLFSSTNQQTQKSKYNNFLLKSLNINKTILLSKNNSNISSTPNTQPSSSKDSQYRSNISSQKTTCDIETMGDYREYINKSASVRSNKFFDNEIKILVVDLFGNQFRPRKEMYAPIYTPAPPNNNPNNMSPTTNIENHPPTDNEVYISPTITETKDELSIINPGQKRSRDDNSSVISINSASTLTSNTVYNSLSDDEGDYTQDLSSAFTNEFLSYDFFEENKRSSSYSKLDEDIKLKTKYNITSEKIARWKLNNEIKKFSRKFVNCFKGKDNLIKLVKDILKLDYLFINKEKKIRFLNRVYKLSEDYEIDKLTLNKLNKIINSYMSM